MERTLQIDRHSFALLLRRHEIGPKVDHFWAKITQLSSDFRSSSLIMSYDTVSFSQITQYIL